MTACLMHTSIGPDDLTEGTVSGVSTVPTVTDNLFSAGTIPERLVAISFEPTTSEEVTNGELFFGKFLVISGSFSLRTHEIIRWNR